MKQSSKPKSRDLARPMTVLRDVEAQQQPKQPQQRPPLTREETLQTLRSNTSSVHRVSTINSRCKTARQKQHALENALASKAYHLPGYGYFRDWLQYIFNNHLVFGMCCRHHRHPIGWRMRIVNLVGSSLFGLAVTNMIWLGYIYYDEDPDSILFEFSISNTTQQASNFTGFDIPDVSNNEVIKNTVGASFVITKGMILLWTLGGSLHGVFDIVVWAVTACTCCLPGNRCERYEGLRWMGSYVTIFVTVLVTAIASFAVVWRATLISAEDMDEARAQSPVSIVGHPMVESLGVFEFCLGYLVEFVLAVFIYTPVFATILFTGVLGCGRVPMLGGRPYEMKQLELYGKEDHL